MESQGSKRTRKKGAGANYVPIYRFMGNELGLSGAELLVFSRIYSFIRCGQPYFESRQRTAEFFGLSRRSVISAMQGLEVKGLIEVIPSCEQAVIAGTKTYGLTDDALKRIDSAIDGEGLSLAQLSHSEEDSPPKDLGSEMSSLPASEERSRDDVKDVHPIPKIDNQDF